MQVVIINHAHLQNFVYYAVKTLLGRGCVSAFVAMKPCVATLLGLVALVSLTQQATGIKERNLPDLYIKVAQSMPLSFGTSPLIFTPCRVLSRINSIEVVV